jgi:hypothetical protein
LIRRVVDQKPRFVRSPRAMAFARLHTVESGGARPADLDMRDRQRTHAKRITSTMRRSTFLNRRGALICEVYAFSKFAPCRRSFLEEDHRVSRGQTNVELVLFNDFLTSHENTLKTLDPHNHTSDTTRALTSHDDRSNLHRSARGTYRAWPPSSRCTTQPSRLSLSTHCPRAPFRLRACMR